MATISDDAKRNREGWTRANADYTHARASHAWAAEVITWEAFDVREDPVDTLGNVDGLEEICVAKKPG